MSKKLKRNKNDEDQSNVWDHHEKRIYRLEILFSILIISFIMLPYLFFRFSSEVFSPHNTNIRYTPAKDETVIPFPISNLPILHVEPPQPDQIIEKDQRGVEEEKKDTSIAEATPHRDGSKNKKQQLPIGSEHRVSSQNKHLAKPKPKLNLDPKYGISSQRHFFQKNAAKNKREETPFKLISPQKRALKEPLPQSYCQKSPILVPFHPTDNTNDQNILEKLVLIQSISSPKSLQDTESAQYKAACRILYEDKKMNDFVLERYCLMVFLFATNQDDKVSDLLDVNTCGFGRRITCIFPFRRTMIECNNDGNIIGIGFCHMGLTGTIPSELAHLRMLEELDLTGNQLSGTIPSELGLLDKLSGLGVYENDLTGSIPSELGNLFNLWIMGLGINKLTGNIPSEIGKMKMLQILALNNNDLEGSIPSELYHCENLIELWFFNNKLTGTISTFIGQLENLRKLDLSNSKLTGTLPPHFGNMRDLKSLNLNLNSLSGSLPDIFGNFSRMDWLGLSNNEFSGAIPDTMWDMNDMTWLWLDKNDLIGSVPIDFCDKIFEFRVDDDFWLFKNSKIDCPCCYNGESSCYWWPFDVTKSMGRSCPQSNIARFEHFMAYNITDEIVGMSSVEYGVDDYITAEVCLSPTGCYNIEYFADRVSFEKYYDYLSTLTTLGLLDSRTIDASFFLSTLDALDSETSDFISIGDECKSFHICKTTIDETHPRRPLLNHLTQHVQFNLNQLNQTNSPKQKALCWMLTMDKLLDNYSICDGTLIQRFIAASLLFQLPEHSNEESNTMKNGLELKDTCDWEGFECDATNTFIERIEMANKKLSGTIMTEIGLLSKLKKIDLSGNQLSGTVHDSIYSNLLDLEVFNVEENDLEGEVPFQIVSNPALKKLNISNNLFVGSLHGGGDCSKNLETIDLSNNIIQGSIPEALIKCHNLTYLDLSQNEFLGNIPEDIDCLMNMKVIKLYQNKFSGSIPVNMFTLSALEIFLMHSNKFTGSIPTEVGLLENLTNITLNHNAMKGPIPNELSNLRKIRHVRLQCNGFTGVAPIIEHFSSSSMKAGINYSYVTNCDVSFPLECESCSICCNVDGECQENTTSELPIWLIPSTIAFFIPIGISILVVLGPQLKKQGMWSSIQINQERDSKTLFNEDSVYAFIFSDDKRAWSIYVIVFIIQLTSFSAFLIATDSRAKNSDKALNMRCPGDSSECVKSYFVNSFGWFLYITITFMYLGKDFAISLIQIFISVEIIGFSSFKNIDVLMFMSGFLLQFLTILGFICSTIYTMAVAETNTDAMGFAVILLFINDLDEKALDLLLRLFPKWTKSCLDSVEEKIKKYFCADPHLDPVSDSNPKTSVSSNAIPASTQGETTNPSFSNPHAVPISIPTGLSRVSSTASSEDSSYQVAVMVQK